MMDKKKILIINLSKGLVGETNMRLIGSMLTTRIFLAAMSRADLSASELAKLPHFYFYVDEFQNFANETFAEILSEARKYKLDLVIAHQYIEQMEEEVRDAVFGNVGTTVVFRVGPFDAEVLETIFMPKFTKEDVVVLDKRQVYLTLMIDGVGSAPFSAVTIPPIEAPPVSYREQVLASSHAQFTVPRTGVETSIIEELAASAASEAPADARMRRRVAPVESQRKPSPLVFIQREVTKPSSGMEIKDVKPLNSETERQTVAQRPTPERQVMSPVVQRDERPAPRPFVHDEGATVRQSTTPVKSFVPRPSIPTKSADDLKAILRTMTVKTSTEKEQKKSEHQQSLKGALADVLTRNEKSSVDNKEQKLPVHSPVPSTTTAPRTVSKENIQEVPVQNNSSAPTPSVGSFPSELRKESKPFEVSEDVLRKVFKGEG